MFYLAIVSLVWAFSFGLIKSNLAGLDPAFVAAARLLLALLVFLPFLRLRALRERKLAVSLLLIGAVQFGLMYVAYVSSFTFLNAYDVAFFTVFTPLYVTLLDDAERRRFHPFFLSMALLAVAGAALALFRRGEGGMPWQGFLLVQASNICFAWGQVHYRRVMEGRENIRDRDVFAILYLGAFLIAAVPAAVSAAAGDSSLVQSVLNLTPRQGWSLLYLGVLASGLCFFLWNLGARRTNTGTLAVFNNVKIPLAIACAILIFGEKPENPCRFFAGFLLTLTALAVNEWQVRKKSFKKLL